MGFRSRAGLDRRSSVPIYHQIREKIRNYIVEKDLQPGTLLPSEAELMELFGASRGTIRAALTALENEGLIYKAQGKGTYVSPPRISGRFRTMISFTEEIKAKGLEPTSKVLEAALIEADEEIAAKMKIEVGDQVYRITRIRYANENPVGLNTSHINAKLCPGFLERADVSVGSLYDYISDLYGLRITKAERVLESIPSCAELSDILEVAPRDPILKLTGLAYTDSGDVLDYCVEYYREDW